MNALLIGARIMLSGGVRWSMESTAETMQQ